MDMNTANSRLTAAEEAFLRALLWEESQLVRGPASRAAAAQGLNLLRCLEAANRLAPDLQTGAYTAPPDGPAEWPWLGQRGPDVLHLLWNRLAAAPQAASLHTGQPIPVR